jgi:hypothetical protein
VFDIGVQRGIFVPKRERETEGGLNWYYEQLHNWSSFCILKMVKLCSVRITGCCTLAGELRYAYKIFIRRSHVELKCSWLGEIKTDGPGIIWKVVKWIAVSQDGEQVVNTEMNLWAT